jgi:hypothetical protein
VLWVQGAVDAIAVIRARQEWDHAIAEFFAIQEIMEHREDNHEFPCAEIYR